MRTRLILLFTYRGSLHPSERLQSTRPRKANTMSNNDGKQAHGPEAAKEIKTILSQTQKNEAQPTERHCKDDRTRNQGRACPPQATPAAPQPPRATAVHITLTLHEGYARCLVGTSKKRPPGDSRDRAEGKSLSGYGHAEAQVRQQGQLLGPHAPGPCSCALSDPPELH
jgi:hypothetical protein